MKKQKQKKSQKDDKVGRFVFVFEGYIFGGSFQDNDDFNSFYLAALEIL